MTGFTVYTDYRIGREIVHADDCAHLKQELRTKPGAPGTRYAVDRGLVEVIEATFCDVMDENMAEDGDDPNDEVARGKIRKAYAEYVVVKPCAKKAGFEMNIE